MNRILLAAKSQPANSVHNATIRSFARKTKPVTSSITTQSKQKEVVKTEPAKPLKIDLRKALHNGPFEGIPLERSKPRTKEDLEHKLQTTKFHTFE